jgi:phage shock protein E
MKPTEILQTLPFLNTASCEAREELSPPSSIAFPARHALLSQFCYLKCYHNMEETSLFWREARRRIGFMSTAEEKIVNGARIIDVRTPAEFRNGSYPGAINVPLASLLTRMNELEPKDAPVVLFCASGARSAQGALLLKMAGFTDVINAGGLEDMPH